MIRMLLLLTSALVLLGVSQPVASPTVETVVEIVDGHCCPEDAPDEDDFDCCDLDMGACCSAHVVGAVAPVLVFRAQVFVAVELEPQRPLHLLVPSDLGPPPTPPPIG